MQECKNNDMAFGTAQKMKFFIKDFFSKCDQIRRKLWIWSHIIKKSLMEDFIFCAVWMVSELDKYEDNEMSSSVRV